MVTQYKKVVIKCSGEGLADERAAINHDKMITFAKRFAVLKEMGVEQLGLVFGGGNIVRGGSCGEGINRERADQAGMAATLVNAYMIASCLEGIGVKYQIFTPQNISFFGTQLRGEKAIKSLEDGYINIYAAGTGRTGCTTDLITAEIAALTRASSIIKLTHSVDGVYNSDPKKDKEAVMFKSILIDEVIEKGLNIMDMEALIIAKNNHIPIDVINMIDPDNVIELIKGAEIGTKIKVR